MSLGPLRSLGLIRSPGPIRVLALAVAAAALAGTAGAQPPAKPSRSDTPCFFISQWQGWKAPNDHTIYLGVNHRDVYEVQLTGGSSMLQDPDAHLISWTRGPDTVCSAIDLQLAVSEPTGGGGFRGGGFGDLRGGFGGDFKEPLIARSLVKLTPEQVQAIPPKYRPF